MSPMPGLDEDIKEKGKVGKIRSKVFKSSWNLKISKTKSLELEKLNIKHYKEEANTWN
jgi:hypothetical protein